MDTSGTAFDDPRVTDQFYRRIDDDCTLVGVVHDHPASIARVETVLETAPPDVVALELPSAAIPLYRRYAREECDPPRFGGEMTAAIRTASDAEVIGIDGPNWSFYRALLSRLIADRVPSKTARRVLSSAGQATQTALTCRLAATLSDVTSMTVVCDDSIEYECDHTDSPTEQAAHERRHVATVQTLLAAGGSEATKYRDEARERCMLEALEAVRSRGRVTAVVGVDHLDALEAGLLGG